MRCDIIAQMEHPSLLHAHLCLSANYHKHLARDLQIRQRQAVSLDLVNCCESGPGINICGVLGGASVGARSSYRPNGISVQHGPPGRSRALPGGGRTGRAVAGVGRAEEWLWTLGTVVGTPAVRRRWWTTSAATLGTVGRQLWTAAEWLGYEVRTLGTAAEVRTVGWPADGLGTDDAAAIWTGAGRMGTAVSTAAAAALWTFRWTVGRLGSEGTAKVWWFAPGVWCPSAWTVGTTRVSLEQSLFFFRKSLLYFLCAQTLIFNLVMLRRGALAIMGNRIKGKRLNLFFKF
jgi:hypothetical protein